MCFSKRTQQETGATLRVTRQQDRQVTPSFPHRRTLAPPAEDLGAQPRAVLPTRAAAPEISSGTDRKSVFRQVCVTGRKAALSILTVEQRNRSARAREEVQGERRRTERVCGGTDASQRGSAARGGRSLLKASQVIKEASQGRKISAF